MTDLQKAHMKWKEGANHNKMEEARKRLQENLNILQKQLEEKDDN